MQLELQFEEKQNTPAHVTLSDLFQAYFDCRKNKRNTANALAFELYYEENLIKLWQEINDGTYRIGRSIAFIVDKPVTREIFAADFRDRVVHHLLLNKTNHLFEKEFIYDTYSCRKGKGALFGVKRIKRFIRSCSENYTRDCYILKMDIQGFFMSINRELLYEKVYELIGCNYYEADKDILIHLSKLIIMNDCTNDVFIKSPAAKWDKLPKNKSLFGSKKNKGLPIGNYTSQVFANYYMSSFDHFVKSKLKIRYYGRYVDDFLLIHNDKEYLQSLIPVIGNFLEKELDLQLHPRKIELLHYKKGVRFTGAYIMPDRIYIERRTKGNFYALIEQWNEIVRNRNGRNKLTREEILSFQSSVNSYLGFMRHYKTYRLRKKMLWKISADFDLYFRNSKNYTQLKALK